MNKEFNFFNRENLNCGRGWYPLIENFLNDVSKTNIPDNFCINDINSKEGKLNFHYSFIPNKTFENLIKKYMEKSSFICENCGRNHKSSPTKDYHNIKITLCSHCYKEYKKMRNEEISREIQKKY